MMITLFTFLLAFDGKLNLKPTLMLQPVPEETEMFLQGTTDLAIDTDGTIYVIDTRSVTIFAWNPDGTYKGNFGKQGQGPGEFSFENAGGGKISVTDKYIYVFDGGTKNVSLFDKEMNFVRSFPLSVANGMVSVFDMATDDRMIVTNSSWFSDVPYRMLAVYSQKGELVNEIQKIEDKTWKYGSEGGQRRVILIPYATTMIAGYDDRNNQLLVGDSATNKFDVVSIDGKKIRTVEVNLLRRDLVKEDKEEWNEQPWFKSQQFFQVAFPDRKPYYNRITPVGESAYLVYVISTFYNNCEGIYVDKEGNTLGRFSMKLGENGGLYGSRGKLIAFTTDDMGEFTGQILQPEI
jgi:hypothetical protein